MITYTRAWSRGRQHPAGGGRGPATVADWAGQSVDVRMQDYAAFLDRGQAANRARIEKILGHKPRENSRE